MIWRHEGKFKLVMAKANMPDIDTLYFLEVALEKDIPVISQKTKIAYFQDMVRHAKGLQSTKMKQVLEANGERNHEDNEGKLKGKRTIDDLTMADSLTTTQCQVLTENGERNHDDNAGMLREKGTIDGNAMPDSGESTPMSSYNYHYHCLFDERKRSIVWTPELHLKFTEAMHMIGENTARPKQILSLMNEPYLTVRQVASHLQKHRSRLKHKENAHNTNLPSLSTSSSLSHKAKFPLPPKESTSGAKEHKRAFDPSVSTPKASFNENHNQNQFFVNNIGIEESNILPVDQNQPAIEYNDLIKKFVEDCDNFDLFENETNPDDVDQYSEMLRTILDGSSSSPWTD
ncbi:Two-component response regulator ORR26 [Glycine soja]